MPPLHSAVSLTRNTSFAQKILQITKRIRQMCDLNLSNCLYLKMFDCTLVSFFILIDNCHFSWSIIYEWVFRALVVVGVTSGSLPDAVRAAAVLEKRLC